MDITDLVTGTLPDAPKSLSPLEILDWKKHKSSPAAVELIEMAKEIAAGDFEKVLLFSCWMSRPNIEVAAPQSWPRRPAQMLRILILAEEAKAGNKEAAKEITDIFDFFAEQLQASAERRLRTETVGNYQRSLDYLYDTFGEETEWVLYKLCDTKIASIRSWRAGKTKPRQMSRAKIASLALRIYDLRAGGISLQKIQSWLSRPLASGRTPLESWTPGRLSEDVCISMEGLG